MLRTGIRWAGTYLTPQQRPSPEWMVSAHAARAISVGPGRQVRVGPRFELPKLQAGLPMLRTGIRWAGTYLTPQQRPSPEWMVSAHAARATSVGPGRQVRVGPRFELPKLQAGLPMLRTGIRWAGK